MIPRQPGEAVSYARRQADSNAWWRVGLCLKFTRTCFNVAAMQNATPAGGYALLAWQRAKYKHGVGSKRPPAGVPVFFDGVGRYGHVAVSAGGGYVYTTDYPLLNRVRKVPITAIELAWGCYMIGWTEDINGVRVWRPPLLDLSDLKKCATTEPGHANLSQHPAQVKALARALRREGLLSAANVTGHYSFAKKRAYAMWQRRLGYTGSDANGVPGETSLRRLCAKYGMDFRL